MIMLRLNNSLIVCMNALPERTDRKKGRRQKGVSK